MPNLTPKFHNEQFQELALKASARQAGVTLLLAILVLSSVLAISFSIATILFIEIRTSADLLRTESALLGAETSSEEIMFKVKQKVPEAAMSYSSQAGGVNLTRTPKPFSDFSFQDVVSTASFNFQNTTNHYALYDPAAASPAAGSGYSKLKVTFLDTGVNSYHYIELYLCQFYPDWSVNPEHPANTYATLPCSDPTPSDYWYSPAPGEQMHPGDPSKVWILDPNRQQELIIVNPQTGGQKNVYVQIEAFVPDGPDDGSDPDPRGIPNADQMEVVDVNANYQGVNRNLRVRVPNY